MSDVYIADELREKVSLLLENRKRSLGSHLGFEFSHFEKSKVVASMPVDERTHQPFGLLHGGASVALAESLASTGAWLNVDESKFAVVGLEINANHIRPVREGKVIGTGTPLHKGRTTHVWEVKITTERGKLVSVSRCTLAVVPLPKKGEAFRRSSE